MLLSRKPQELIQSIPRLGCLWTAACRSAPSPAAKSATIPSSRPPAVANSTKSFARWDGVNISSINAGTTGSCRHRGDIVDENIPSSIASVRSRSGVVIHKFDLGTAGKREEHRAERVRASP